MATFIGTIIPVNSVVRSSFFQLRTISKIRHFLSPSDLERVINAFISSRLDFCNSLYSSITQTTISRLQLIQNTAAQLLTRTKKRDHITPILASLHWLPVHFRIHFKILLIVYKSLHGLAPSYISENLTLYTTTRTLRSSDRGMLAVPRSQKTKVGDWAFSVEAPRLWNSLPEAIRKADSVEALKKHLKTPFYSLAFNSV